MSKALFDDESDEGDYQAQEVVETPAVDQ
jgi:hypothetical protein